MMAKGPESTKCSWKTRQGVGRIYQANPWDSGLIANDLNLKAGEVRVQIRRADFRLYLRKLLPIYLDTRGPGELDGVVLVGF
jgi:hypothetical protein